MRTSLINVHHRSEVQSYYLLIGTARGILKMGNVPSWSMNLGHVGHSVLAVRTLWKQNRNYCLQLEQLLSILAYQKQMVVAMQQMLLSIFILSRQ